MKTLLPEEKVRTDVHAEEPWKRSTTDHMLELYFSGVHPERIAIKLGRKFKAINRRIEALRGNEGGLAERYEPYRRTSRKGKRITPNERLFIRAHRKKGIKIGVTSKILQRPMSEVYLDKNDYDKIADLKRIGPGVDLVMAYRYLYYCHNVSIMTDQAYDAIEREEREFGAHGHVLDNAPGSDNPEDYAPHIRALGLYLRFKYGTPKDG